MGLDRATGETLWTHDLYDEDPGASAVAWWSVFGAVTDGKHVAVTVPVTPSEGVDMSTAQKKTVALDLGSGAVVWTTTGPLAPQAIAGRLYRIDTDALVALE